MNTRLIDNKKIAVIGGGPVGLITARLLQMRGANVKVYERDKSKDHRISGGTLDIHHDIGQLALKEAGLLDSYITNSRAVAERGNDMYGNLVEEDFPTEENKFMRPEIDRRDLRKIVLDVLDPDTVVWDKQFDHITKQNGQYILSFKDGSTTIADIIIAADGGKSKLRPLLTNETKVYTGTTIIQGDIQKPEILSADIIKIAGKGNMMALGEQKMIFTQYRRDGSLNYYVSFSQPENWFQTLGLNLNNLSQITAYLKDIFQNWHPAYHQLFSATNEFQVLPMYVLPVEKPWNYFDNLTLVGDAAHLMPPFAGIGVNIGLLDALNLVNNLTNDKFSTVKDAIEAYVAQMFKYAKEAQLGTMEAETGIHHIDAINITKDKAGRR